MKRLPSEDQAAYRARRAAANAETKFKRTHGRLVAGTGTGKPFVRADYEREQAELQRKMILCWLLVQHVFVCILPPAEPKAAA